MEEQFFKSFSGPTGSLLYQTKWKKNEQSEPTSVFIYEKCIKYNDEALPYTFDLKFMTNQNTITFYILDHEKTMILVNNDSTIWRDHLKKFINQTGFHEQFKPIKKVGKGNFASVYMVEKIEDKTKYAVKAFSKEAAYSQQNGKECLIKEIEIMRNLQNKHNMRLEEVFQSEHSLYIIFELLEGGQLFEKIKAKQKFKTWQIKKIVKGLLEGLRQMHSKNIMHRDLKPQNILFRTKEGFDAVIGDYGLSQFSDAEQYLFVRCGTPGYVAPQVINIKDMKAKYSPICDIFSLGLIFHLILFSRSVFNGKSYSQVLKENRACTFSLEGEEYKDVDPIVMDLLKKMLKINPEERITADQALSHPFFKESEQDEEEELEMNQNLDKVEIGHSPILPSTVEKKEMSKRIKKDSCISLKIGNENLITGKTETVGTMGSGSISGFGANLLKGLKASKFVKPDEVKENQLHL